MNYEPTDGGRASYAPNESETAPCAPSPLCAVFLC